MATASRFKIVSDGRVPRLREHDGWKACPKAKKKALRARAMQGPHGVCCPGCKEVCALPVEIKAGMEFVVMMPEAI